MKIEEPKLLPTDVSADGSSDETIAELLGGEETTPDTQKPVKPEYADTQVVRMVRINPDGTKTNA
ncbi:MAG: hypothetical protein A2848_00600 [Candidatus Magasanikbacteria bacterium RIFCSPHIGHO2_01_FULL_50_8]|uniref:Uncharacterized protein n=2 Tax=Candidatus Magasanikiibacteriota TaxID=1752731 RepID=A0A1F6LS58_9BACT|nr:MAG: hypothetical protein A2848_00600 [Candidatus Magasanikbacteria bacterium RIFCSPHIGHO2_01_FULL_50_8]OGH67936.1 MAG: hypothetical protein A3C15_00170 [Candidatus Magasanikbacteria bacterium RIFCSPHIGHO2_02_FULL_50_9b]